MTFGVEQIKELMKALADCGLTELRIEQDGMELRLTRQPVTVTAAPAAPAAEAAPEPAAPAAEKAGTLVCSPIVGTFYDSPSPDAEPYVKVGDTVHKGDVLFIIESMKLMNEVTSEYDGRVAEVLAHSGEPVEYGQPLLRLE